MVDRHDVHGPIVKLVAVDAFLFAGAADALLADFHGIDVNLEHAALLDALDVDRAGCRIHAVPVKPINGVLVGLNLVREAVLRMNAHGLAGIHGQYGFRIFGESEQYLLIT